MPPGETFLCRKCRHTECLVAMRSVKVTIGWPKLQIVGVAPARMCTKCGDLTIPINAEVGDLAGVVLEETAAAAAPPPPDSDDPFDGLTDAPPPNRRARRASKASKATKKKKAKKGPPKRNK